MRHALEADHVAAVASLTRKKHSLSYTIKQGAFWGIGHTITLFLFGSIVLFMDTVIPEYLSKRLEVAVAIMLVLLGADVLRRLTCGKNDFHVHVHVDKFPMHALLIGLMHGMAGSAAVILLTLDADTSPITGMFYILFFGIGSMLGMAILSAAITLPLRLFATHLTWASSFLQLVLGMMTISIGILMLYQHLS